MKKIQLPSNVQTNIRKYSMFILLVLIFAVFSALTGGINASPRNITNIFIQNSYILILAVGMILVIITGHIDLSVGSVCAFTGALSAIAYNAGVPLIVSFFLAIIAGAGIGAFQGFWIAFMKVPSFIVTLAGMLMFRGLTYIITGISPITPKDSSYKSIVSKYIPDLFSKKEIYTVGDFHSFSLVLAIIFILLYIALTLLARRKKQKLGFQIQSMGVTVIKMILVSVVVLTIVSIFAQYRGIPNVVIVMAVVIAIFVFITKKTVLGRHIYAVGGNAQAAKLSGINAELITFIVFTIMGALAGLAGVIFTAYLNSALPQAGELFELEAIAASFIGGASAAGGIGTVIGAITGGLVMGVINNGMSLMNLGASYQFVVKALVLLLAVWYDLYSRKRNQKV